MACGRRALVVAAAVVCASAVLGGGRHASVAAAAPSLHSGRSLAASAAAPASSITSADVEKTTLALLEAAELQAAVSDSMVRRKGGKKRARESESKLTFFCRWVVCLFQEKKTREPR